MASDQTLSPSVEQEIRSIGATLQQNKVEIAGGSYVPPAPPAPPGDAPPSRERSPTLEK